MSRSWGDFTAPDGSLIRIDVSEILLVRATRTDEVIGINDCTYLMFKNGKYQVVKGEMSEILILIANAHL